VLSLELRGHVATFIPVLFMLSVSMIGTTILTILFPIVVERTEINRLILKEIKSSERVGAFFTLLLTALFIWWMITLEVYATS
jgi:hypothetical protein